MLGLGGHMRALMATISPSGHACYASGHSQCVEASDLDVSGGGRFLRWRRQVSQYGDQLGISEPLRQSPALDRHKSSKSGRCPLLCLKIQSCCWANRAYEHRPQGSCRTPGAQPSLVYPMSLAGVQVSAWQPPSWPLPLLPSAMAWRRWQCTQGRAALMSASVAQQHCPSSSQAPM